MQISGKTVLVSGGASGLGGATVEMIVAAGGNAVILDVNEQAGRALAERLGKNARFVKTDVTSSDAVQAAVGEAKQAFGAIHGAVCTAGVAVAERVLPKEGPQPLERFARVINVNLVGTFNVVRLAADAMAANTPT